MQASKIKVYKIIQFSLAISILLVNVYNKIDTNFNFYDLILFISDHWCAPPLGFEPESLNLTLEQWKQIFLPTEIGPGF